MPTHSFHHSLPGYNPAQILHDGCEVCEYRGLRPERAIQYMDDRIFQKAWERATAYVTGKLDVDTVASAEVTVLDTLAAVQMQLAKRGIPMGDLPGKLRPIYDDEGE